MVLQLRIVDREGHERIVKLEPGTAVTIHPGETVTLVNLDAAVNIVVDRAGDNLVIHMTDGSAATLEGFFHQAASGAPNAAFVFQDSEGTHVLSGDQQVVTGGYTIPTTEGLPLPEDTVYPENGLPVAGGEGGLVVRSALLLPPAENPPGHELQPTPEQQATAHEIFAGSLNAGPAEFSVDPAVGREGSTLTFTVTRSGNLRGTDSIDFSTQILGSNNATSGVDFTPVQGTLHFAPSQTTATVVVHLTADYPLVDPNETFSLSLKNAVTDRANGEVLIKTHEATGTIRQR